MHLNHTRPTLLRVRAVLGPTNFRRIAATAAVSSAAAASFGDMADSNWVPGGLEDTGAMRALSRPIRELIGFVTASVTRRSQVSFTRSAAKPLLAASPVHSLCCRGKLFGSGWHSVPEAAGSCARRKQTYVPHQQTRQSGFLHGTLQVSNLGTYSAVDLSCWLVAWHRQALCGHVIAHVTLAIRCWCCACQPCTSMV